MLSRIDYKNFKVLKSASLPLSRMTLLVGPNGSGKSTAVEPFRWLQVGGNPYDELKTAGTPADQPVEVVFHWATPYEGWTSYAQWTKDARTPPKNRPVEGAKPVSSKPDPRWLRQFHAYALNATQIVEPAALRPNAALASDGTGLAVVLDRLRDQEPERFEELNATLGKWLPEFDRVLFETPADGRRAFLLRTAQEGHAIPARHLSQGTVLALAILTLAYLPQPPPILCFEEPDRGIHPRLMRDVQDALYRLSYPESCGESRAPVQVIATTHSPYLLDLFRDHPEEVVIANKLPDGTADFERLSDRDDLNEILGDSELGDAWYTGVLGGVPDVP